MSVLSPEMRPNSFATAQLKSGLLVKENKQTNTHHKVLTELPVTLQIIFYSE